jgi:nitroreductase
MVHSTEPIPPAQQPAPALRSGQPRLHPLITARWSPRGLDPAATVSPAELRVLFEAASWAASSGNLQPYRYLLGRRGSTTFERILGVLKPRNQHWARAAAALALGIAVTADDSGRPMPYARYDLGQATAQLALQAVAGGLVVHQMAGFFPDAATAEFALPPYHEPAVAIAIGVLGTPDQLPDDLRSRETRPRHRRPLSETVFTDTYGTPAF